MPHYLRLTYVSRATFAASRDTGGIDPEVARILAQSRRNNPRRGLVGALYWSDGCFFQCLEGRTEEVEGLYERLHQDPRHRELTVLSREPIDQPSFEAWSMKFVPNASEVRALMARHGRSGFDPYTFDPSLCRAMVNLLLHGPEGLLPPDQLPQRRPATSLAVAARRANLALALAGAGLLLASLSLALALLR